MALQSDAVNRGIAERARASQKAARNELKGQGSTKSSKRAIAVGRVVAPRATRAVVHASAKVKAAKAGRAGKGRTAAIPSGGAKSIPKTGGSE